MESNEARIAREIAASGRPLCQEDYEIIVAANRQTSLAAAKREASQAWLAYTEADADLDMLDCDIRQFERERDEAQQALDRGLKCRRDLLEQHRRLLRAYLAADGQVSVLSSPEHQPEDGEVGSPPLDPSEIEAARVAREYPTQ